MSRTTNQLLRAAALFSAIAIAVGMLAVTRDASATPAADTLAEAEQQVRDAREAVDRAKVTTKDARASGTASRSTRLARST